MMQKINPIQNPTQNPSVSPSFMMIPNPTNNPTIDMTMNPTTKLTQIPIKDPTSNPSQKSHSISYFITKYVTYETLKIITNNLLTDTKCKDKYVPKFNININDNTLWDEFR